MIRYGVIGTGMMGCEHIRGIGHTSWVLAQRRGKGLMLNP